VDHGTTFRIYLPPVDAAGDAVPARQHVEAAGRDTELLPAGQETLLFVEDDELVSALATRALRAAGYDVIVAPAGEAALRLAAGMKGRIRLLLTDIMMPGMNGRELADQLLRRYPDIGVIYMSGYTDDILSRHGEAQPEAAFLEKPFTPEALTRLVRQVLDERRAAAANRTFTHP
jgi:CheY-like chemotaxis protein